MGDQAGKTGISQMGEVILFLTMGVSVFFINESVRSIFVTSSFANYFNMPFIMAAGLAILIHFMAGRLSPMIVITALGFWCITLLTNYNSGENAFKYAVVITNLIIPLLLTGVMMNAETSKIVFTRFVKILNAVIIMMILIGIPDILSGGRVQLFMIQHIFDPDVARLATIDNDSGIYRFYFIFGHTLSIAWYFLLFFMVNVFHNRTLGVIFPSYVISAITFVGLVLCNSRTALLIGLAMIIFLNRPRKRAFAYYMAIVLLLGGVLSLPMVQENIKQRFVSGIESGSVSGGRNEAVLMVFDGIVEPPGMVLGTGMGSSRKVTEKMGRFVESFEYPLIMLGYDFSIIGTFLIYLVILILPVLHFITLRHWQTVAVFLFVTLYINGFNMLSGYTDYMGQVCFVIMLMKNVAYHHACAQELAPEAPGTEIPTPA